MIISASHAFFHEARTCDSLELPFPGVPELVRRCMMNENGPPKRPRQLHLGQHSRSKGHARRNTQIDFMHRSEWPPAGKRCSDGVLGSRGMLHDVIPRPQQIGRLIKSISRRCFLQCDDVGSKRLKLRPRNLPATLPGGMINRQDVEVSTRIV
jgi:hypothetical protein